MIKNCSMYSKYFFIDIYCKIIIIQKSFILCPSIMSFSPILLSKYSNNPQIACMQRTGELITVKIIDPEIKRIKNTLLYDVFVTPGNDESLIHHISTILTKEYEMPTITELDIFITKVPTLLEDPSINYEEKNKITKMIDEKKNILF